MTPVLLGLLVAISWGVADFTARFSSRAIGPPSALLWMMAAGLAAMAGGWLAAGRGLPPLMAVTAWDGAHAVLVVVSMLLFYEALRRGPLSVAAPLTGAYPAWALLIGVGLLGIRPTLPAWAGMAVVMFGVWTVAGQRERKESLADGRATVAMALASGFVFALAILAGQRATAIHGESVALWYARLIGCALLLLILLPRSRLRLPRGRWGPIIMAQGLLDAAGYVLLYAAGSGSEGAVTTVISAGFGAVTVLLARTMLREGIALRQWGGIAMIIGGAAVLASQP